MILKELLKYLDADVSTLVGEFKLTMIGTRALFVQNYVKILNYSNSKIVFKIKNDIVTITGENFNIKEMGKHEIVLVGKVFTILSERGQGEKI